MADHREGVRIQESRCDVSREMLLRPCHWPDKKSRFLTPMEERRDMDWQRFRDRKHGIWIALMLALVCALDGCASKRAVGLIEGLGTYTFDGGLKLSVTTRGMSLMQYERRQGSG